MPPVGFQGQGPPHGQIVTAACMLGRRDLRSFKAIPRITKIDSGKFIR